jgi:hypothetical protein
MLLSPDRTTSYLAISILGFENAIKNKHRLTRTFVFCDSVPSILEEGDADQLLGLSKLIWVQSLQHGQNLTYFSGLRKFRDASLKQSLLSVQHEVEGT